MADIELLVGYDQAKKANQEILRIGSNAQKSASVFQKAFSKVETEQRKQLANVRQQVTASQRLERQKQREADIAAKASQREAAAQRQLRMEYQQGYATFASARAEMRRLNQAKQNGIITADRYAKEIRELRTEYQAFTTQANDVTMANNRFARQVQVGNVRSMNNLGVAMQQSGYQIGDFLVQVQSGTNWMVAFGQQATQLVGILPMFSQSLGMSATRLIGISAGLGIVIPLVTALGGAFMRTRQNTEEATTSIDRLETAISSANSALQIHEMSVIDLADKYGVLAFEVRNAFVEIAKVDFRNAVRDLDLGIKAFDDISEKIQEINRLQTQMDLFGGSDVKINKFKLDLKVMAAQLGLNVEEANNLNLAIENFASARGIENQKIALLDLRNIFAEIPEEVRDVDSELDNAIKAVDELFNSVVELDRATNKLEESAPGSDWMNGAIQGVNALYNRIVAAISGVNTLKASASDRPVGMQTRPKAAPSLVDEEAYASGRPPATRPRLPSIDSGFGTLSGSSGGGGGGGGGAARPDPREMLKALEDELRIKRLLIGVNEQQAEAIKLEEELKKKLAEVGQTVTDADRERIQTLTQEAQAIRDAVEAEKRRTAELERFEKRIEDAIVEMAKTADSIEDVFLGLLQSILEEFYRAEVAKPIGNLVGDLLGGVLGGGSKDPIPSANGNLFSGGRIVPFANGGVVNSPTLFPMRGSNTGLMGEAGPEAIMPLKRGPGGKLGVVSSGNAGNVVVNQSFNFSANGDESVKKIIAGEAPKLSQLALQTVLRERRRGAIKKDFG